MASDKCQKWITVNINTALYNEDKICYFDVHYVCYIMFVQHNEPVGALQISIITVVIISVKISEQRDLVFERRHMTTTTKT